MRSSTRKRTRISYTDSDNHEDEMIMSPARGDEEEENEDDEDDEIEDNQLPNVNLNIEKILGRKYIRNSTASVNGSEEKKSSGKETETDQAGEGAIDEVFLIKWKGLSYIHISWEYRDDLLRVDPGAKLKLKRLATSGLSPALLGDPTKPGSLGDLDDDEIEYFSSELTEIQRIISCDTPSCRHSTCQSIQEMEEMTNDPEDGDLHVQYLVKWRGAPYCECSWERWEDIKQSTSEIFNFWKRQRPPKLPSKPIGHPSIQEYQRLVVSPKFGTYEENDDETSELTLRDYQLEGVNWLLWNWWHKRPCILADEMGLGKTIQSVCFLHQLQHMPTTQVAGPFLLVAPLSLINQWQNEIALWSPNMNCVVMHGSAESRDIIQQYEFFYQEPFTSRPDVISMKKNNRCKFDIMLTTYEIAVKESKIFNKINWRVLIVDEAHRLKNQSSRLFEQLQLLPRDYCVLLTGTPLQNKTEELFSLLHFADRNKFSSQADFLSRFGDLRDANDVARLHGVLKPHLLRRVKEDVEKSLPPKEETIIEVALTPLQKQFYRAIYERNTHFLFKGAKASNQPSLMNIMMELRKCCNHPYLIKGVEDRIISEMAAAQQGSSSSPAAADGPESVNHEEALQLKMIESSGKLVLLDKLLPRLYAEGHKVLIFSQMVKVLNLLEDYLRYKNYSFERLDGSTRSIDRHSAVERFCRASLKKFIMLLSTKAGGLGLNLTSADTVIIFDSDWNPHNDIQAQARAHRIGQTKAVMVYRLLTRKTYEMHMFHKASLKLGLDRAVLAHARNEQEMPSQEEDSNGMEPSSKIGLQVKEIDELLKRGAYDVFRDEDTTEQNDFVEADIDVIMQRRAHKVSYEGMTTNAISNSLGGFSKASFVSADEKEDVDINDPDFWKKAIGFSEPSSVTEDPFVKDLPQQRKRKQTQVFGEDPATSQKEIDDLLQEDLNEQIEILPPPAVMKKEKKATEPKPPKEPKDNKLWGSHSRDRVLRALLQFGFGRWERIQRESGSMTRDQKEVELFVRSYMLQVGLCAGETPTMKGDTQFISDAISAARVIHESMKKGEVTGMELPPILLEEKFLGKLKNSARKVLHKLELLSKLNEMVESTLERVYVKKPEFERMSSIEEAVAVIPPAEIATELPLGNVRPSWTRPRNWWDEECDRHLVLGVFIHGYGKYHEIRDDNRFIFQTKMRDWAMNTRALLRAHNDNDTGSGGGFHPLSGKEMQYSDDVAISHFTTPSGQECRVLISNTRHSEYKGVYSQPGSVKWMAQYGDELSNVYLGTYDTELLAAHAYDDYAREIEGAEKAQCNFDKKDGGKRVKYDLDKTKRPILPWHRASKYRGVRASGAKWTAQISYDGGNHHLGTFCSEIEAAVAYDTAAIDHHGTNAISNFPFGVEKELIKFTEEPGVHVEFLGSGISTTSRLNEAILKSRPQSLVNSEEKEGKSSPSPVNEENNGGPKKKKAREGDDDMESGGDDEEGEGDENPPTSFGDPKLDLEVGMPDARVLNRLFTWLVTSEAARMSKDEMEKKTKANKKARMQDLAGKREELAKQAAEEDRVLNIQLGERGILSLNYALFDSDAQHFSQKRSLLKKCEANVKNKTPRVDAASSQPPMSPPTDQTSQSEMTSDIELSEEEVKRLCSALLLFGAPFEDPRLPLDASLLVSSVGISPSILTDHSQEPPTLSSQHSHSTSSSVVSLESSEDDLPLSEPDLMALAESEDLKLLAEEAIRLSSFEELPPSSSSAAPIHKLKTFSWHDLLSYADVHLSIKQVSTFYTHIWLPFCVAISKTQSFANRVILPNPYLPPSSHSVSSKGLCSIFMQRQRNYRAVRYILSRHLNPLMSYLKSNASKYHSIGVPVWWCPWIHDLAMMIGYLKHGYMALEPITKDPTLPFTAEAIYNHVCRTFLYGSSTCLPAARGIFTSTEEALAWAKYSAQLFPDQFTLENRLIKILSDLTKHLPLRHMCRITYSEDVDDLSYESKKCGVVLDSPELHPILPLPTFLQESEKRRRLEITQNHPLIFFSA
jgi:superfamily II DNA or RNA helicase